MIGKKILDVSSAYFQLILMVFLPIAVLTAFGIYLVEKESSRIIDAEQQTIATAALIRSEPMAKEVLNELIKTQKTVINSPAISHEVDASSHSDENNQVPTSNHILSEPVSMQTVQYQVSKALATMNNDQRINRVLIVDDKGEMVASSNLKTSPIWVDKAPKIESFIDGVPTTMGRAYGTSLGEINGQNYWLLVDMDNKPNTIKHLKVWLILGLIGLLTLLILLLSLNIYARRWIVPIYDLRLHLQQIKPDNMYHPVNTNSSGELNQLQQDIVKTFRRIYADFQELKDHAYQTEEDLRDAFDEMEMQNIFIREARDQAISSSEAKSEFLANISHELRTPLNSIDGFINLLARHGQLSAEQNLYVQTIRKSSAHLLALVNDVLDFSKIEAGKLQLDKHEFNLYATIYDVMDMLSPLAAEKNIRMAVLYYNDVPNTIIGDALRVKQVLTNLVGNAIKFTDVGEVVVRVGLDESTALEEELAKNLGSKELDLYSGDMIHIAIQDTGQGISSDAQNQLFNSFSQGDPTITRKYGGTGLGLSISKRLTQLMGGKIGFYDNAQESQGDQVVMPGLANGVATNGAEVTQLVTKMPAKIGSTFWFSIPAYVNMEDDIDTEFGSYTANDANDVIKLPELRPFSGADTNAKGQSAKFSEKPFEMLVWIDHATSLQVFMAAVRPLNIKVTQARSLVGALDSLKEFGNFWDWVIIDSGEGELREEGAALLKQIRLHYQGKLSIYGYQVSMDARLLERYKAFGLHQPLDKRQLYSMLDSRSNRKVSQIAPPVWQGISVLAVDDHLPNLLVLDALLSELGIEVITANSGFDAIEIVSKQLTLQNAWASDITENKKPVDLSNNFKNDKQIDLIFMDMQMPRMAGDEAAKQIRDLEFKALKEAGLINNDKDTKIFEENRIPIIALTAQGLSDKKELMVAAGIDDYVGKPISRPQLLQILQRWLGKGGEAPVRLTDKQADTDKQTSNTNNQSTKVFKDNLESIVDWQDALNRSANKPDLAKQLLQMMQESIPAELEALDEAWHKRDRDSLSQIAHRILGASRYTGVPQIREASQTFEDKCLLNKQHTTALQFEKLQPYYYELLASLKALQKVDVEAVIANKNKQDDDKPLSENDMTWKMI